MIPFVVEQARPSCDSRDTNVVVHVGVSPSYKELDKAIIDHMVQVMYEFCSEEYGHGLTIVSYSDFCDKFWNLSEVQMRYWSSVFEVRYFYRKWHTWNMAEHQEHLYQQYQQFTLNKNKEK